MKTTSTELNSTELIILQAIKLAHKNAGGDFTYADEVLSEVNQILLTNQTAQPTHLTYPQVKGYLSQLSQKGYISIDPYEFHQINFCKKALEIYPDLEKTCQIY